MIKYDIRPIVRQVMKVCGEGAPLHQAIIDETDRGNVFDCVTNEPTGYGFIDQLQNEIKLYTGAKHAIAVSSGTSALRLALVGCGVGSGDIVVCPSLTFVGTVNAIIHCGGEPHFVDAQRDNLGLDPAKLREYLGSLSPEDSKRVKAIVAVHLLGIPCDISGILSVAYEYGLAVVEDAAESLGSWNGKTHTGLSGSAGIFSFNNNKIVTTGGGGMVVTNDDKIAGLTYHLATTAKVPHKWRFIHDMVGYNDRMPNICAAMGVGQVRRLARTLELKLTVAERYQDTYLNMIEEPKGTTTNYWLNAAIVEWKFPTMRGDILTALHAKKIMARPIFTPMHKLPMYKSCPHGDLTNTNMLAETILCLPSSPALGALHESRNSIG